MKPKAKRRRRVIATFLILVHLLGIASAVHAIMHTRTEQGAIAWSISLVAFPYVAVPAYWVLGRSRFEGYVTARRLSEEVGEDLLKSVRQSVLPCQLASQDVDSATLAAQRLAD